MYCTHIRHEVAIPPPPYPGGRGGGVRGGDFVPTTVARKCIHRLLPTTGPLMVREISEDYSGPGGVCLLRPVIKPQVCSRTRSVVDGLSMANAHLLMGNEAYRMQQSRQRPDRS